MNKLLVVDDEALVRKVVRRILEKHGFEILEAEDGDAALELVASEKPSMMLLDIRMPRVDGLETLRGALKLHPGMRVIIISGMMDEKKAVQLMHEGACDYVTKPIDPSYLKGSVWANSFLAS